MKVTVALVGVCVSLLSGPSGAQDNKPPSGVKPLLQTEGGRYVFGQISEYRQDQFMLDTRTGRLWQIVQGKDAKGENTMKLLQVVPYTNMLDDKWSVDPR